MQERGSGNIAILLLCKWNVVNVVFTMLWIATQGLLSKIIVHAPMVIALRTGAIQSPSRKQILHVAKMSVTHAYARPHCDLIGHVHIIPDVDMSKHGYSDVTRPFFSLAKGLVPQTTLTQSL